MGSSFLLNERVKIRRGYDDETIIIDQDGGRIYSLNATGSRILFELLERGDLNQCAELLAELHSADYKDIVRDMRELSDELSTRGILISTDNLLTVESSTLL